ncbi:uncharacterized protein BDV14DRAFT_199129 [Aspergillus stella-maris]|uniref:uncharacterized protein n=1 Tax=Aspergillus stella-maris TaxID=1810926 RepID=UPI003CCCBB5C
MSKLSPALKALINHPSARPNTVPAPANIRAVYKGIQDVAGGKGVKDSSWIALSTAATMTMNSPASLTALFEQATSSPSTSNEKKQIQTAELIREVGLKCISFNGIPRTINCLGAFKASLPTHISSQLSTTPTRAPSPENISSISERGKRTWDSIYRPFETKLYEKLGDSHPDLPVHILHANYGALLSDPERTTGASVGRVGTSIVAIACLRAQTGVGPQVTSHVFGLRKALEDGSWKDDKEGESEEGLRWLAGEEGNEWIIRSVDEIVKEIGGGEGTNFAPGLRAKL